MRLQPIYILFVLSFSFSTFSQTPLQLSEIMKGDDFIGHQPYNAVWSPDGNHIYFRWNNTPEVIHSYYDYNVKSKRYKVLKPEETRTLPVEGYYESADHQVFYYKRGGNLYEWNDKNCKLLFSITSPYSVYRILNNGNVIIQLDDDFYLIDKVTNQFIQLTQFSKGEPSTDSKKTSFLEDQQIELFDHERKIKSEAEKRAVEKSRYKTQLQPTLYLYNTSLEWAETDNNTNWIVYETVEYPKNEETQYASFVTADGYTQLKNARPKVGSQDPSHFLGVYSKELDTSFLVSTENLSGIYNKPEYLVKEGETKKWSEPKNVIFHSHGFNSEQKSLLIEVKSYDNKDRWLALLDDKGALTEINHQHDATWIGGPGISGWNMVPGNCGWIDNDVLYFQSEESGYSHLYTYNCTTKKTTQLTSGNFEIHEAKLSKDKKSFFISSNKNHPGNRSFYRFNISSNTWEDILTENGNHEVAVSPNEKQLAIRYSYKNKPWEMYISNLEKDAQKQSFTKSTTAEFDNYKWREPEIITFKAKDGTTVYARLYKPTEQLKNQAGIIFVHGAGYLQNAHNWWSGYHREYMFHNLLADKGYTILDIDYRASKGYGRDFRTGIYRHMGGLDLSDQIDGADYMIKELEIDSERIGIYGGSYGGFITLMAMLTEPNKFKCGAALRSVTDWAHYNHQYTSNILNTPETDPEAFKKSSPIYFAENLKNKLLMLHGMEDDNVQYQDVVRLSQRFIELGKDNWDLIGYPVEKHGFQEATSWTDEYRRILNLFDSQLNP
ncbi:prolyl oligopeptidase family serine peptidase [Paracrocinitomix mangrovi]|uniref:S9 family peptidase n=1 Tax=Paracrocinitomix mangrovi TaxID=2862509 RepID=UPI001C8DD1D7|nr:prolyl oligopeptidase family serine peptidase [Paracrocinitomix mangrovi]UKN02991.1 prolyl oligopeptidase family serine peptidase [Paracrocinitomix mangrovi]